MKRTHASALWRPSRRTLGVLLLCVIVAATLCLPIVFAATDAGTGLAPSPALAGTINALQPPQFPCSSNWSVASH